MGSGDLSCQYMAQMKTGILNVSTVAYANSILNFGGIHGQTWLHLLRLYLYETSHVFTGAHIWVITQISNPSPRSRPSFSPQLL